MQNSLPCQHIVCNECLREICKVDRKARSEGEQGEEIVKCPQCRQTVPRDEVELVQYTAVAQWDELLEVARKWAEIDRRGAEDTSEEEDTESFIKDESTELRYEQINIFELVY